MEINKSGKHILILTESADSTFNDVTWMKACALQDAGHKVSFLCPASDERHEEPMQKDGIDVYFYDLKDQIGRKTGHKFFLCKNHQQKKSAELFKQNAFDAIHGIHPSTYVTKTANYFKRKGVKFVLDQAFLKQHESNGTDDARTFKHNFPGALLKRVDGILTPDAKLREKIIYYASFNPQMIEVVRHISEKEEEKMGQGEKEVQLVNKDLLWDVERKRLLDFYQMLFR